MKLADKNSENQCTLIKFGKSLKLHREQQNLTQEALAFKAGFSRSYYTEVENGKRNISLINITRLSKVLNVSVSELLKEI
jgi:transcriptional regulator with XRE-family HTH domain